jgi:acyl carrier protein
MAQQIDWAVALAPGQARSHWGFLEEFAGIGQTAELSEAAAGDLRLELEGVPAEDRLQVLKEYLRTRVVEVLGVGSGASLRDDQPITELGLDSLMALELKNELQRATAVTLPANFFFEHTTVDAASTYIDAMLLVTSQDTQRAADSAEFEELTL